MFCLIILSRAVIKCFILNEISIVSDTSNLLKLLHFVIFRFNNSLYTIVSPLAIPSQPAGGHRTGILLVGSCPSLMPGQSPASSAR